MLFLCCLEWTLSFSTIEMLAPAFTDMSTVQWGTMPSDTNGVESLNKCSIDHSNRSKTLEACLEFTYRLDKKTTLEHIYSYNGLPISFQRKTVQSCKERAARQNKARCKKTYSTATSEDDIGLKGKYQLEIFIAPLIYVVYHEY